METPTKHIDNHWSIRTWMLGVPLAQSKAGVSARSSICNGMSSIPPLSHSSMLSLMFLCPGSGCYFHFVICQCSRIVGSIFTSPRCSSTVGWVEVGRPKCAKALLPSDKHCGREWGGCCNCCCAGFVLVSMGFFPSNKSVFQIFEK